MINNYNSLDIGMVTWFKKGIGIREGSPPGSQSVVTKPSWLVVLLLLLSLTVGQKSFAQTYFTESFENAWYLNGNSSTAATSAGPNAPSGWTQSRPVNNVAPGGGTTTSGPQDWAQAAYSASAYLGTTTPYVGSTVYGTSYAPGTPPNGNKVLWFKDGGCSSGNTRLMGSPAVDLSSSTSPVISFSYSYPGTGAFSLVGSLDGGTTWSAITTLTSTATNTWVSKTVTIPTAYKIATAKFGFQIASSWGSYDVFVDNIVVREGVAPTAAPISFTTSSVTGSGMTIGWTDNSTNETAFNVYRSIDNTNFSLIGSVTSTTSAGIGTTYSQAQTGLTPGVTYYYRVAAAVEVESAFLTGNLATTAAATYYYVGSTTAGDFSTAANWNTNANGTGTTRTVAAATDILIIDGTNTGSTNNSGTTVTISMGAAQSLGGLQITNNTTVILQSSSTTTRALTLTGCVGDELSIASGSTLSMTSTSNAATIGFSTGTGMTGTVAGTLTVGGSTANIVTTTGGTATLVTVTGTVNLQHSVVGLVGSAATLSFAAGSNVNCSGATTGAPTVPLGTWATTSTLTISGITTSTTAPTNNAQSFGNLVYNCPSATGTMSWFTTTTTGVIKGDLTITAGATAGTGIFRAVTSGTLTVNGNINVLQGRLQSASSTGTLIALGNTTISANGILDILAGTFSQRGTTFTNNGTLTGPVGTLQFLNLTGSFAQTLAGSGSVLTNVATLSMQNTAGLTLSQSNQLILARVNLFQGTITNGNKITFGTGAAVNCTTQIGSAGLTTPGGSFNAAPTFNLGTGTYNVLYAQESVARTTGFEIPTTRAISALTLSNSNGLTVSGGALATGTLTFSALSGGNITTTSANLLTVTGTATSSVVRTLATAYVNGPLALTLPASLVSGSTYTFPIGKGSLNTFALVNPTTNAGGTVTVVAEAFDGNSGGTAGSGMVSLNTNRYWAASIAAGSANFTSSLIQLNDAPAGADTVASSASQTGAYAIFGGVTTTATASSLTTTTPATSLPGFFVMGVKAVPSLGSLAITPTGSVCTNVARNVSVVVTPGGAAISGVTISYQVNGGTAQTVAMTNSTNAGGLNADTWTGTIPTVTPSTGTVTWSVTATDVNSIPKSLAGTSYTDVPSAGASVSISGTTQSFCGTGGSSTLTATSTDTSMTYAWTKLTASSSVDTTSGATVVATVSETSDFMVTGTNPSGCIATAYYSVGVYPLPSATVTTTASGVCPGTSATIGSGLSAGNFTVSSITYKPYTIPTNAVTVINNTTATTSLSGGSLDDGGWSGIPIGFNFNFFGTNFSSIAAGTNGLLMFGAVPGYGTGAGQLGQYSFNTTGGVFPNTNNPGNVIALMAGDQTFSGAGKLVYWTEGYAPNRKFILLYENVPNCCSSTNPKFTAYVTLYETLGIVDVSILSKLNTNSCTVGLQDATKTIGAVATGRQNFSTTITTPEAWRFSPPSNYTTVWTKTDASGTSTIASGTNIFTQSVSPSQTTTYSISYTNQITGCVNAANSAQVVMSVINATPPSTTAVSDVASVCSGGTANLSLTGNVNNIGNTDGLTYQWQFSLNGGSTWSNVTGATNAALAAVPTDITTYQCLVTSCSGTAVASSPVTVNFTNKVSSTTPATRCGAGSISLSASTVSAGASLKWYAAATGGTALYTGPTYTIANLAATTTYYVAAETTGCSSPRVAVTATVNAAPTLTLSQSAATICNGSSSSAVTITAGASSFDTYTWTPSTGVTGNSTTGWVFNPTVSTVYTLSATQSTGDLCANSASVAITVNTTNVTATASASVVCSGNPVTLSASSLGLSTGPQTMPTGYAASYATNTTDEDILNVTLGTLNNTSTCSTTGGGSSLLNQYSDFTSLAAPTLTSGQTLPISISVGTCGGNYSNWTNVYIDYNRNGIFESSEQAYTSTASTTGAHLETGSITIPSTASAGVTLMRVYVTEFGSATSSPSTTYSWGETEDYKVNIIGSADVTSSYTYSWSNGTSTVGSGSTVSVNPTATTTYTVTATNPTTLCTNTASTTVTVNPIIIAPIAGASNELCIPNGLSLSDTTANGVWSSSNTAVATVSTGGAVTGLSAGTTTISYSLTIDGCTSSQTYPVTVNQPVTVTDSTPAQVVLTGSNTSFSVTATGTGLTYQWLVSTDGGDSYNNVSGSVYGGATTSTLTLTGIPLSFDQNLYKCLVSGSGSCAAISSSVASLSVGDTGIETQPISQTICSSGSGSATFSIVAAGDVVSYYWEEDQGGDNWTTLSDGGIYSGTTTNTLVLSGLTTANSTWRYRCSAAGSTTTATSNPASLTVIPAIVVTTAPANQSVCYTGGTATFGVASTGTVSGYQWQVSINGSSFANVADGTPAGVTYTSASTTTLGVTTTTLGVTTTGATSITGTYLYRLVLAAPTQCSAVTSSAAQLNFTTPTITATTSSSLICSPGGSAVTLTASGAGTGGTYTWAPTTGLTGTGASVSANPTATTTYTVTGTTAAGCSNTATVSVTVGNAVTAFATASPSTICPGDTVTLNGGGSTNFSTGAVANYIYTNNSGSIDPMVGATNIGIAPNDDTPYAATNIGFSFSFNGTSYTQFSASPDGFIRLGGTTASSQYTNAMASTTNAPKLAAYWDDLALGGSGLGGYVRTASIGTAPNRIRIIEWNVTIPRNTTGTPNSVFQMWLYEGTNRVEYRYDTMGSATMAASIGLVGAGGSGGYLSLDLDAQTTSSTTAVDTIASQPGQGTVFTFSSPNEPSFNYAWTSNPAGFTSTLATPTVNPTVNTTYNVVVTSAQGCSNAASTAVTIQSGAAITADLPATAAVCQGGSQTFSVTATGPGLTYQWYNAAGAISGATTASYAIANAVVSNSGAYYVVVTPSCGAPVTSNTVTFTVNPTPTVTTPSAFPASCSGNNTLAFSLNGTPSGVTYDITGGSAIGLANQTGVTAIPSFAATTGTATLVITPSANGCTGSPINYTVNVNPTPSAITLTPSTATICNSDTTPVAVSLTGGTAAGSLPVVFGTGTTVNTSTSYPSPFSNYYGGAKHQMLVRASELTSRGFAAGDNISAMAINVQSVGTTFTGSLASFSVAVGNTTNTVLNSTSFVSGLTTVRNAATLAVPTTGLPANVNIPFDTQFTWDGTSNIVIQTSYSNANFGTTTDTVITANSDPGFVSTSYYRVDSNTPATVLAATTPTGSGNARPNFVLSKVTIPSYTWSSSVANSFTDAAGANATSTATGTSVYVKPSATATITATSTLGTCTSSGTAAITVNNATASSQSVSACNTYTWSVNGQTYTTSGTYTYVSTNAAGCTDTKTLILTINNSTTTDENATACDSYTWNGTTYTASGDYTFTSTNAAGCTNVATLHLTINNSTASSQTVTACDTYTWSINGQTYTTSGTYTFTSTNASGCTDVKTLVLTINNSTTSEETVTACDSYTWNGTKYKTSGDKTFTSTNAAGCTHVATLHLTINRSTTTTDTVTACDSYTWNGTTYSTSGVYTFNGTNAAGCPNVATLRLTINNSTSSNTSITACDSYTWNGTTYTTSGVYTFTSTNASGCPNVDTLNLTINNSTTTPPQTVTACNSYVWNGTTYTSSGVYTFTSTNTAGCTNTATLNLTINSNVITNQPTNPTICSLAGATATVSATIAGATSATTYQWFTQTPTGTTWTALTNGANYAGVTTPSLTIIRSAAAVPVVGTKYQLRVTVACGSTFSNVVTLQNQIVLSKATAVSVTSTLTPALTTCSGNSVNLSLAAGSVGNIQWQTSLDGTTFIDSGSPIAQSALNAYNLAIPFTSGSLTQTTWFRAVASNGVCTSAISTAIKITVSQPTTVGTVSALSTSLCTTGSTTLTLTSATGGTIAWQKAVGTAAFAAVAGNTTTTLNTGALSATTSYRVVVSNTGSACPVSTSNVVTIAVSPASTVKAVSLATTGSICLGQSKTLNLASGSIGSIQWQANVSSSTTAPTSTDANWSDISGATNPATLTVTPTTTTWYRVVSTSSPCSSIASAAVQVVVNQPTSVGALSAVTTSVCTGNGTTLTVNGAVGTIGWQKAVGTAAFAAVSGNVTPTLNTGNLSATTSYRVVVTSGACPSATSNSVTIVVSPAAVAKTISGNAGATTSATAVSICSTSTKLLMYTTTGSVGAIQWQYINVGTNASTTAPVATDSRWADITGAVTATYNAPVLNQVGNIWFRVKLTSSPCSASAFSAAVNVWLKTCPTTARTEEAPVAAFSAMAYPSPFTENFTLNVTTPSEDKVQVMVYDMIGKLVDQREVSPSDAATLEIGDRYPSGVYNVIVTQGDNTKTLRVIKR